MSSLIEIRRTLRGRAGSIIMVRVERVNSRRRRMVARRMKALGLPLHRIARACSMTARRLDAVLAAPASGLGPDWSALVARGMAELEQAGQAA